MIFGRLKVWALAAVGILAGVLYALLGITKRQRDKAREESERQERRAETAEARNQQRQQADKASQTAKEEGDKRVQEAVDRARTGRRDHFE